MAREIKVNIVGDASSYQKALGQAQQHTGKFSKAIGTGLKVAALGGAAALGGLAVAAKIGFDEFNQGQKELAQTNAVLKSTGRIAGVTAKHVEDLSESLMKQTGIDDELITSGQNLLLTFTGIRNQVGKNNDIFDQATKLSLDLSVAMGTDMRSSALQVGKALNDPFRGYTRLRRIGVSFSATQEALIKKFEESGDVMGAQKVILKELRKEFGGSAKAAGTTFAGSINILRESFNNWAGDMVSKVMPRLQDFTERLSKAEGFKAKFKVAFVGIKAGAQEAWDAFSDLVTGTSQSKPLKLKSGKIIEFVGPMPGLADRITDTLRDVDWASLGATIGENISSKVRLTAELMTRVFEQISGFVDQHLDEFAEIGVKLGLTMLHKLSDPEFWVKNWQLILGVAVAFVPVGKFATLGGTLAKALGKRWGADMLTLLPAGAKAAVTLTIKELGKIGGYLKTEFLAVLKHVPGWFQEAFRLVTWITFITAIQNGVAKIKAAISGMVDFIQRQLGRIPGMTTAVRVAFFGILGPIQLTIAAVQRLIDWIGRIPSPGSIVGSAYDQTLGRIPGLASGGHITRSGMAVVHRGENVVPARAVRAGNGGGSSGGPMQLALVAVGPDILRQLRELERRSRLGGSLA